MTSDVTDNIVKHRYRAISSTGALVGGFSREARHGVPETWTAQGWNISVPERETPPTYEDARRDGP